VAPTLVFMSATRQPAGWRRAQLCGQQAITLKKLGAAISAACEELQVSGHRMAFVGGHDLR
jgi:hypothetical protein